MIGPEALGPCDEALEETLFPLPHGIGFFFFFSIQTCLLFGCRNFRDVTVLRHGML